MSSSVYEWVSELLLRSARSGVGYSVAKYADSVRIQAALLREEGAEIRPVAYFRNEEDAREFARLVMGGVKGENEK